MTALCNPLVINVISFFFLSLCAFRANLPYLFHGLDGRALASLISTLNIFFPFTLGFSNDFINGLGNISFPINPWLIPGYFFSTSTAGIFTDFPLAYAICATTLFLATYMAARLTTIPPLVALIAAWLVSIISFQYVGWPLVPSTWRTTPHYAAANGVISVVAVALLYIGTRGLMIAAVIAAACFLGISYVVVTSPDTLILSGPELATFGLAATLVAAKNRRVLPTFVLFAAMAVACALAGYFHFLAGLVAYTAPSIFTQLSVPTSLAEASMLFWNPVYPDFFTVERTFVLLGLIGGLWGLFGQTGVLRWTAAAFLSLAASYLIIGIINAFHAFWPGPALYYFESFLFPFHAMFCVLFVVEMIKLAARSATRLVAIRWRLTRPLSLLASGTLIAIVPWFLISYAQTGARPADLPFFASHPQSQTAITKVLKGRIALQPGSPFRGRVATFMGRIYPVSTNVSFLTVAGVPELLSMRASGNSHSFAGLWQDSIPTLLEYNEFMSPAYFAFMRAFFTEPVDRQIRNLLSMRHIDSRLLELLGVRFIITDSPYSGAAQLRTTIDVPVSSDYLSRIGVRERTPSFKLYLYELQNPNVGQYSPSRPVTVRSASEMIQRLGDPDLDLSQTFLTAESFGPNLSLIPAKLREFSVERGGFRLRASSVAPSVLILPLEFSRCLRITTRNQLSAPRLFRADLLLSGVLFAGELDATIEYRNGPFGAAGCRLQDAADARSIQLENAFENHPEFAPAAVRAD